MPFAAIWRWYERLCSIARGQAVNEDSGTEGAPKHNPDDSVRELVWVLRRAMYLFLAWAERRYGWKRPPADDDR